MYISNNTTAKFYRDCYNNNVHKRSTCSTSMMICRPTGKGEEMVMAVVVDGVQIEGLGLVKLLANWDLTKNRTFSIAVHVNM